MSTSANNGNHNIGFDKLAWCYDALTTLIFAGQLQKSQKAYLDHIEIGTSVLIIGGGTGWILKEILKHCRPRKITYIESSRKMLELSVKNIPAGSSIQVDFILSTAECFVLQETYDIVVTNFILDLFNPLTLESIMLRIYGLLKDKGKWIYTDFREIKGNFFNKLLLKSMYLFFGKLCRIEATTLADTKKLFSNLPLSVLKETSFYFGNIESVLLEKYIPQ